MADNLPPPIQFNFDAIWTYAKWMVSNVSPFVMIGTAAAVTFAIVALIAWIMSDQKDEDEEEYDEEYY